VADRWATWLAERRFGGDEDARRESQEMFDEFRRRVLDAARIEEGDTVLDVGCGEGLIGFGALGLVGEDGRVIFSDISEDVLNVCRAIADDDARCEFVRASADELPLEDASVDAVTTRSVVIYLDDKEAALREFFRVLRRGGRLSMFEPINRFGWPEPDGVVFGYDVRDVWDVAKKIRGCYGAETLVGWDDRDLLPWGRSGGLHRHRAHARAGSKAIPAGPDAQLGRLSELRPESARADAAGGHGRGVDDGGEGAARWPPAPARRARRRVVPHGLGVRPRRQDLACR
jgi:arsenite methyltransferase